MEFTEIQEEDKIPSLNWGDFWRALWQLLLPFRRLIYSIFAITLFSALLDLAKPYILKLLIDNLYNFQSLDLAFLFWLIA